MNRWRGLFETTHSSPSHRIGRGRAAVLIAAALTCLGWADSWQGFRQAADRIRTVRAEFVQEKHLPILARPLVSTGVFYYKQPNSLRWEYRTPARSILLLHAGNAQRFVQDGDHLSPDPGLHVEAMQMVMSQVAAWVTGRFDENPMFEARLEKGPRIVLTPKDPAMARMIRRLVLEPSQRPGVLKTVTLHEGPEAFTRMEFHNTEINPPLDDEVFRAVR